MSAVTPQKPTKKNARRKTAAKKQPRLKRKPHESFDELHLRVWNAIYESRRKAAAETE
ncbi:MAG TPA: hypothetical protein VE821_12810 [Pyrinomonadaceae bacterium]|nr:hypothetical protein [Pyrinomonadaceae bacterium]